MSTRRTSTPFAENSRTQNGTNDNSRIMDSADENAINSAHEHEQAHDNPAHDDDGLEQPFAYPGKDLSFLNDLQNATSKRWLMYTVCVSSVSVKKHCKCVLETHVVWTEPSHRLHYSQTNLVNYYSAHVMKWDYRVLFDVTLLYEYFFKSNLLYIILYIVYISGAIQNVSHVFVYIYTSMYLFVIKYLSLL